MEGFHPVVAETKMFKKHCHGILLKCYDLSFDTKDPFQDLILGYGVSESKVML